MTDLLPQFESEDLIGTTKHFNGSVSGTWVAVPSTPNRVIAEAFARCAIDQSSKNRLFVSFDGGAGYLLLAPGEAVGWSIKSSKELASGVVSGITQVFLKGSVPGVTYELVLNREGI